MKKIFVEDSLGKEYSGEFNSVWEAFKFYQNELDDDEILITRAYMELPELKKFAENYYKENEIESHYETDVAEYGYDEYGVYRGAVGKELVLEDFPIIFKNENYQDLLEAEIKKLIKEDEED